jgi:hypothetical protein
METCMLIHDDIYSWEGFGGMLALASGRCRLRIFDLAETEGGKVMQIKPMVVVVSDLPENSTSFKKLSVRSCTGHIATGVSRDFNIDPHRMLYLEYQPASAYGIQNQHRIDAKLDVVDLQWHAGKALHPQWRPLNPPLRDVVLDLIQKTE